MKGKINEDGELEISRRGGGYKVQHCRLDYNKQPCSDDCPLFSEPFQEEIHRADGTGKTDDMVALSLCKKVLMFRPDKFTDER